MTTGQTQVHAWLTTKSTITQQICIWIMERNSNALQFCYLFTNKCRRKVRVTSAHSHPPSSFVSLPACRFFISSWSLQVLADSRIVSGRIGTLSVEMTHRRDKQNKRNKAIVWVWKNQLTAGGGVGDREGFILPLLGDPLRCLNDLYYCFGIGNCGIWFIFCSRIFTESPFLELSENAPDFEGSTRIIWKTLSKTRGKLSRDSWIFLAPSSLPWHPIIDSEGFSAGFSTTAWDVTPIDISANRSLIDKQAPLQGEWRHAAFSGPPGRIWFNPMQWVPRRGAGASIIIRWWKHRNESRTSLGSRSDAAMAGAGEILSERHQRIRQSSTDLGSDRCFGILDTIYGESGKKGRIKFGRVIIYI